MPPETPETASRALDRPPRDEVFRQLAEHWDGQAVLPLPWVLIALALLLLLLSGLSVAHWWRRRDSRPAPWRVFRRVTDELGLEWSQRWLLWRIARRQELPTPLTLLISPGTLTHHAEAYAAACGARRAEAVRDRVQRLCVTLFPNAVAKPAPTNDSADAG